MSIWRKRQIILLSLLILTTYGLYVYSQVDFINKTHLSEVEIKTLLKRSGFGYYFQPCKCIKHKTKSRVINLGFKSTCSEEADWLGPGQKVVSYVIQNTNNGSNLSKKIKHGIISNIYEIKQFYPDWILRLYSDLNLTKEYCEFACIDEVMWCDIRSLTFATTSISFRLWNFFPIGGLTVEAYY